MQSFDGPVVTQFQMCWVELTAWLCNSTGPPPLWLKMLSALKKNLPLSGGYQRWSFLKDMLLVWKVKYSWARTWKCHLLSSHVKETYLYQTVLASAASSWPPFHEQQGWAYATDFLQTSMVQAVFSNFEISLLHLSMCTKTTLAP